MRWQYLLSTRRWPVEVQPAAPPSFSASSSNYSTSPTTSEELPELVAWVKQHGGRAEGATLANLAGRDGGSGWGLKASKAVGPGTSLIFLPSACHLSYGSDADPRLLRLIDQVPAELWGAKLALQLLAQRVRGTESPFDAYIRHLPKGFPGVPIFFGKRAIDLIDYPPVSEQVKRRCKWLYDFSQKVLKDLPGTAEDPFDGTLVDINALGWAMACVSSRAFRTRGPQHPAAMLPLVDMANHTFDPNCEVLPAKWGIALVTRREVAPGEPLLLSYGKLSNDFLFMDYGFVVPDNPYDTVQLRFDLGLLQAGCLVSNATDALGNPLDLSVTPWKVALLADQGLVGPSANTELSIGGPGEVLDPRLVAAARVLVARREAEVAGRSRERLADVAKPLSRENEAAALRVVGGVVAVALSNFNTTLEHDKALLGIAPGAESAQGVGTGTDAEGNGVLGEDEALAVRFRMEKKRVLTRALQRVAALSAAVAADVELRASAGAVSAKKGAKPAPATSKGFGSKK